MLKIVLYKYYQNVQHQNYTYSGILNNGDRFMSGFPSLYYKPGMAGGTL